MVTGSPTSPLIGRKLSIFGKTAKAVGLAQVPSGVVTVIKPVVVPTGTVAVIWVYELTVNTAEIPLNETSVAPVKLVPVSITSSPTKPLVGAKLMMLGVTIKSVAVVNDPTVLMTVIAPVVAPMGTVVVIWTSEFTVKVANVPLKSTEVAVQNPVPYNITVVPTGPLAGKKPDISGMFTGTKSVALVADPTEEITFILPVVAVAGTVAMISVGDVTWKRQKLVSIKTSVTL
jgi:hypothetical protein